MIPLLIAGGLTAAVAYSYLGQNLVSASEAKRLIKEGKIKKVIDVRTAVEWRAGHYPKALHIPVDKINEKNDDGTSQERFTRLLQYGATGQICGREIGRSWIQGCVLHRWTLFFLTLVLLPEPFSISVAHSDPE